MNKSQKNKNSDVPAKKKHQTDYRQLFTESNEALRQSEMKLSTLLQTIPDPMDIVDEDLNVLWMSDKMTEILNDVRKVKSYKGKKCFEMYRDDKTQCQYCPMRKKIKVGETKAHVTGHVFKGKVFQITHTGMIYEGKKAILEIFKDVTELYQTSKKLEKSEALYKTLVETSPDCIKLMDRKGNLEFLNKGGLIEHRLKSLDQALRKKWNPLGTIITEDRPIFKKAFKEALKGKSQTIEIRHTKEGSIREACMLSMAPVKEGGVVTKVFGVSRDITEMEKTEEMLQVFKRGFETSPNSMVWAEYKNNQPQILKVNESFTHYYGYTEKEVLGKNPSVVRSDYLGKEYYRKMWKSLLDPKIGFWRDEIVNKKKDGGLIDVILSITTLFDKKGKPEYFIAYHVDITERTKIEKTKTEFVSLASHQLRTPPTGVKWYVNMLLDEDVGKINRKQKAYLKEIRSNNQRMIDLVHALLSVSRIELGTFVREHKKIKIKKVIEDVLDELESSIKNKQLSIELIIGKNIPIMEADPSSLRIVIQNLVSNAVEYTPDKGRITIEASRKSSKMYISVKDTGCGIPKKEQEKIFEKFYRADNAVKVSNYGTGLGLYIAKTMTEVMGGSVAFKSSVDRGSTFYLTLPVIAKKEGE